MPDSDHTPPDAVPPTDSLGTPSPTPAPSPPPASLAQLEGPLFEAVQHARIFPDSKTFVDAVARADADRILEAFARLETPVGPERLEAFVREWFDLPDEPAGPAQPAAPDAAAPKVEDSGNAPDAAAHIRRLWPDLFRDAGGGVATARSERSLHEPGSSLIPLPHPYVVPGGRFREIYYWDSFFTAQGLILDGHTDMVLAMARNFASMVRRLGHIPNGNRLYYHSRSQPPFFAQMAALLEERLGPGVIRELLPEMVAEWRFWVARRSVRLADGTRVFHYGDERAAPREESHAEDVETARGVLPEKREVLYRHLRAACESGWDFSSRWLADPMRLETIRTGEILPVDLNTLLWSMQLRLAGWIEAHGEAIKGLRGVAVGETEPAPDPEGLREEAAKLGTWIRRELWDEGAGLFMDGEREGGRGRTGSRHMGGFYPLAFGLAGQEQARRALETLEREFLRPGGLVTTLARTGQQWDAPNGWAPLQWIGVEAAARGGREDLAREAAGRWTALNEAVFARTGKMLEKYDVEDLSKVGGGGEYPNQDGFGWTNGVFQAFRARWGDSGNSGNGGVGGNGGRAAEVGR